ncbi:MULTISPECIES: DUF296 domain-containing protein [unclassified Paracoccus (in: a-proteobacteria)]|uniref:DUF296 domain-containing protein n=1 Tax=unclassified Paracoccus (in: a-proteobacteria) TaxID=2688777 RepID=UPI001602463A|nr:MULTISPECIES: DUF296 domain-containing protein [unclassified Paracoccus (in: a-proteobacteria)]MBB1491424.1 DUF296 domain-containing protein [Paracoccus sp. MC1854]MBB1497692.1 DUF296 domain-containing protein [Paracoccus sp. MC1862]QQO44126.1 DUF296 domain-containing protein [Paracoccus sp. MC1862]
MIHPGPRAAERLQAAKTRLVPVAGVLQAGETVMAGVARLFARAGCPGGVVFLEGVSCDPMRYVLPALSSDASHAAWYSTTFAPEGRVWIEAATASVGRRDGAAFLHCHGLWTTSEGKAMGHLLPFDSVVAEETAVTGIGARDAWFDSRPDAETNFTLFQISGGLPDAPGLIARIAPGEDVVTAVEGLCAGAGWSAARVHGLGSIDHILFQNGTRVDCLATELRFAGARLENGRAHLPIDVVDIDGAISHGVLARGANPVGVTLELLIEPFKDRP